MRKEAVYIDSCVWIAQYKPTEAQSELDRQGMKSLFDSVERNSIVVVASTLLFVEALTVSAETLEMAFDGSKGVFVAADDPICRQARELELKCYKDHQQILSPFDAVHLTTASLYECSKFVTLDKRRKERQLAPLSHAQYLEKLLGVQIVKPGDATDQPQLGI